MLFPEGCRSPSSESIKQALKIPASKPYRWNDKSKTFKLYCQKQPDPVGQDGELIIEVATHMLPILNSR